MLGNILEPLPRAKRGVEDRITSIGGSGPRLRLPWRLRRCVIISDGCAVRATRTKSSAVAVLTSIRSAASSKATSSNLIEVAAPLRSRRADSLALRAASPMKLPQTDTASWSATATRFPGVSYETAQDVTGLEGQRALNRLVAGQPASVKYDPANPSNSILVADDWSGL